MKALTVQQPWAWAIALGAKKIENRTQSWRHRGPLAIHAGARVSERGVGMVPELMARDGWGSADSIRQWMLEEIVHGAVIAVTDLADVHWTVASDCCGTWAEQAYTEVTSSGVRRRTEVAHLVLDDVLALNEPVPCKGRLGLWNLPEDVAEIIDLHASGVL